MVTVELTPEGWNAVWQWVQARSLQPEQQSEVDWRKHAVRSINLIPPGEPLRVCMRGAVSASGYLEALVLQPGWYRRIEASNGLLQPLPMMA